MYIFVYDKQEETVVTMKKRKYSDYLLGVALHCFPPRARRAATDSLSSSSEGSAEFCLE